jgi:hypothetical protein
MSGVDVIMANCSRNVLPTFATVKKDKFDTVIIKLTAVNI